MYVGCDCPVCQATRLFVVPPPDGCESCGGSCDSCTDTTVEIRLCPVKGIHEKSETTIQGKPFCKHCGAWKEDW